MVDLVELTCVQYELLKENLEESGFTVRAYVQQTESKKFPKVDKKSLEGGGENTLMSRIMKSMEHQVNDKEFEKGVKIQYGFIADVPGPKKALCIVNVDEVMFESKKGEKGASIPGLYTTLEGRREQWKIVGEIRNGEAKFWCTEEETKSYFDSLGLIGNTAWQDLAEEKMEKEREERRKEKRAAKKHRRMMTESTTATTPSEMSFGFRLTEDEEEVVKARQRAKQNEKRKKQKQRRREEAMEANNTTSENGSDSDDTKSDDSGKKKWSTIAKQGNRAVQQNKQGEYKVVTFTDLPEDSGVGSNGEDSAEEERRPKVKLPVMQHQRLDKEVRVDEEGLETVMVQSVEEARQYMHRPMLVAWPQEDGSEKRTLYSDLSFIGRGL